MLSEHHFDANVKRFDVKAAWLIPSWIRFDLQ